MPLLKDSEREQLRQLVKACLLEISKLKIELKKSQKESKEASKLSTESIKEKDQKINELEKAITEKDKKILEIIGLLDQKNVELEELRKIKQRFDALTAKPKKDLTSFQSQIYQVLSYDKGTIEDLYDQIIDIGFKELSFDNFNSILRNLGRKGYFKSYKEGERIIWEKIEK